MRRKRERERESERKREIAKEKERRLYSRITEAEQSDHGRESIL